MNEVSPNGLLAKGLFLYKSENFVAARDFLNKGKFALWVHDGKHLIRKYVFHSEFKLCVQCRMLEGVGKHAFENACIHTSRILLRDEQNGKC